MAYVNPATQNIRACFQSRYSLPYFQREYKWESRHFTELLNDIQNAFLASYDPSHGRKDVASYAPYFLGSIITSSTSSGIKPLIDGQQRLTSAFLILAYLERYKHDNSIANTAEIGTLLGSTSFGSTDYAIEFTDTRRDIFTKYLNKDKGLDEALNDAEEIDGLDDGDRRLLDALRTTGDLLDATIKTAIPYFIDYVVERILLIDISVESEAEAHRVFVTMNDRGLRLGPIDLLKGQILSKITHEQDSHDCHDIWTTTISRLRALDPEEDSLFFRNLFRALWATSMRGKSKGDTAGDFELIVDEYHRWFEDNTAKMGLNNTDSYVKFVRETIPHYDEAYRLIRRSETTFTPEFSAIFYNAARRYNFQSMILLATILPTDTTDIWKRKIALAARYIDIILSSRTIEGKENNYDNLKELSFQMARDLRGKTEADLLTHIQADWKKYSDTLDQLKNLKYAKAERQEILFFLARIAAYLEDATGLTNKVGFYSYWQRDRNTKTFDIEHVFADKFDPTTMAPTHGFIDAKEYAEARNLIGALTLLPRSRNRSLQDKPYAEKLAAYSTENILTQTMCDSLYDSNPNIKTYATNNPNLGLEGIPVFNKNHIQIRGNLYTEVAKMIWASP